MPAPSPANGTEPCVTFPIQLRVLTNSKQFGVFATRAITKGEVVFCESTSIVVSHAKVSAREQSLGLSDKAVKYGTLFTCWDAMDKLIKSAKTGHWVRLLAPRNPAQSWPISHQLTDRAADEKELTKVVLKYATGKDPSDQADSTLLSLLLAKAQQNMFNCLSDDGVWFSLLCGFGSLFNHSCAANCHSLAGLIGPAQNELGFLRVFASRDIKAGEEISILYADVACNSFAARSAELSTRTMTCWCKFCTEARTSKLPLSSVTTTFGDLPLSGCLWCGNQQQRPAGAWSCSDACTQHCKNDLKDFVEPASFTKKSFDAFFRTFQRAMSPKWTMDDIRQNMQFVASDTKSIVEWMDAQLKN